MCFQTSTTAAGTALTQAVDYNAFAGRFNPVSGKQFATPIWVTCSGNIKDLSFEQLKPQKAAESIAETSTRG